MAGATDALNAARRILVIKPSSLGDVVHTLAAVHDLKRTRPETGISWLVNPEWAPLLEGNPDLTRVLHFPRNTFRGLRGIGKLRSWWKAQQWEQPDAVLDFQGLLRSALIARGTRSPIIAGLSDAREGSRFFYHAVARVNGCMHSVERYRALAELAGADLAHRTAFPLPQGEKPAGFDDSEPFLLLHPFSRGEKKSMSMAQVRELCEALAPTRVVLVGRWQGDSAEGVRADNWLNRTSLTELVWLCRRTRFFCSVDSGPMHLGAAVGCPLVGLHTWTDPRKVGPYHDDAWVWKGGSFHTFAAWKSGQVSKADEITLPDPHALAAFLSTKL